MANDITMLEKVNHLEKYSIDFHNHGVGDFDFTEIQAINLQAIENILAQREQYTILTLYLPKPKFQVFLHLLEVFDRAKKAGQLPHIIGFGLEGPLLASHGGTPEMGVWAPDVSHWRKLAACGKKGLIYCVFSPDALLPGSNFSAELNLPNISWITETLLLGGVLPTPGHFTKSNPSESARQLHALFKVVDEWGQCPTITDHLFNDMPHNFKHAWRTPSEKANRDAELRLLDLNSWNLDNLEEKLGPVPATIIQYARKGIVKICQNFDGEHVDLAIVKKIVELVGAENMLLMTDAIESKRLAGRALHLKEESTLLYQDADIVAAGSQNISQQIQNMLSIGLTDHQIQLLTKIVPLQILRQRKKYLDGAFNAEVDYL